MDMAGIGGAGATESVCTDEVSAAKGEEQGVLPPHLQPVPVWTRPLFVGAVIALLILAYWIF